MSFPRMRPWAAPLFCLALAGIVLAQTATTTQPAPTPTSQPLPPSTNPTQKVIYPAGGQSEQQQMNDQLEAYRWATKQTNWDPYQAYDVLVQKGYAAEQTAQQAQGGLVKGAAKGAIGGALIGAIAGDAGKGAAIGAAAGGLLGNSKSKRATQSANAQAEQATAEFKRQLDLWDRNYMACLSGKGYTVN